MPGWFFVDAVLITDDGMPAALPTPPSVEANYNPHDRVDVVPTQQSRPILRRPHPVQFRGQSADLNASIGANDAAVLAASNDKGNTYLIDTIETSATPDESVEIANAIDIAPLSPWSNTSDSTRHATLLNDTAMQTDVVAAMEWAWKGYRTYAFGHDWLNVVTMADQGEGHDMALSLVDSLDTLFLLGLLDEFNEAADWAEANMPARHTQPGRVSLFETTIRNLGGYLSAYHLSGRPKLLALAKDLGTRLCRGLDKSALPQSLVSLVDGSTSDASYLAEFTTIQLEFKYLSTLTGDSTYTNAVETIMNKVARIVDATYPNGILPVIADSYSGRLQHGQIKLGAGGDSYYEYLLKQWLLSGKTDSKYKAMYETAVTGIMDKLVGRTKKSGWVFLGELEVNGDLTPKMDHLVCFMPGMLALGYMHGMPSSHLDLAKALGRTCFEMYNQMASNLAPEIAYFNTVDDSNDIQVHASDAFNILRPETVESLMVLYRVTRDETYREWGKVIFRAFEQHCRLPQGGYSSVNHVDSPAPSKFFRREMESFFMAETLKYFYLLFSDESVVPLDQFVFNTEAHPFPIQYQWVLVAGAICYFLNVMYLASKYGMLEGLLPKNKALRRVNAADANARDATATSRRVVTPSETLHPLIAMPTLTNDTNMQRQVTAAMSWAWGAYRKHAFGFDSLNVKDMVKDGLPGHDMAISLVDSLDSLYIMGLQDEFNEAVDWAESNLAARFPLPPRVSIFETTIRNLGGLLSAYTLCGRPALLTLADDLGARLHRGLNETALPLSLVSLVDGSTSDSSYVAEFTTIQLEFKYLAQLTGKTEYHDTVELLMDKKATKYKDMYINAVNGIMTTLVGRTKKSNWLFLGELDTARGLSPKMDHLVCFVPGMLALGYVNGMPRSHLTLAQELVHTCFQVCVHPTMA
ncbi:hypothetical protein DYB25_006012 [Aphanomyces astaci]|uniref:alpha-1,2-Mannosidase n=1 Tax=Aphanomyces astaci TaxID=112090 RepID=A0A397B8Y5_APHAT|nr:hypothetical protein DYB25_006012 [Aphanomyces astaci]